MACSRIGSSGGINALPSLKTADSEVSLVKSVVYASIKSCTETRDLLWRELTRVSMGDLRYFEEIVIVASSAIGRSTRVRPAIFGNLEVLVRFEALRGFPNGLSVVPKLKER